MQVGVIGLGRHWQTRYKPALRALGDRFHVRLVCDQVQQRALREARQLGCAAALGPTELLQSDAVEAVLLTDAQWFGLWPLEQACRFGKPVFCGDELLPDEPDLDHLEQQARARGLPVLVGLTPRHAAAMPQLLDLLAGPLGPARGVTCDFFLPPRPPGPRAGAGNPGPTVPLGLLDWCAGILDAEPVGVLAGGTDDGRFSSLLLEFPDDRRAQLTGWQVGAVWQPPRLQVVAERGWASVDLSGRLRWVDAEGRHSHVPRRAPSAEEVLLDRFFHAVCSGHSPRPGLADACRLRAWLRAAERSRTEGARARIG
jgi:predicted dehydrogenase